MNTHLITAVTAGAVSHSTATTITVTSLNSVKVHAAPQPTTATSKSLMAMSSNTTPSPNVNIGSKRARLSSKDKELNRKASCTDIVPSGSIVVLKKEIGGKERISLENGMKNNDFRNEKNGILLTGVKLSMHKNYFFPIQIYKT